MITAIIQNYSNGVLVSTLEFKWRLLYGRDEKKRKQLTLSRSKKSAEMWHTESWGYHGVYSPPYGGGARGEGLLVCCSINFIQS